MLNISGEQYFRYKMPSMQIEIENSKTIIHNMDEVMQALDRPLDYILKYMSIKVIDDICIIDGEHSRDKLELLLYKFIEEYVLCPRCKCPSTNLYSKRRMLKLHCMLCNQKSSILNPCKYILKSEIDKGPMKVYLK